MTPITAVIIDDEKLNARFLKNLVLQHCPHITLLATETNARTGLQLINELRPQLLFLDVEMPQLNGFDLLKQADEIGFEVIFVTAYSHYAIEAFEHRATGYLTKPIDTDKLVAAVATATLRIEQKLKSSLAVQEDPVLPGLSEQKIPLSTSGGLMFVKMCDILYCESSGNYTYIHLQDGRRVIVTRQLGEYERMLPDSLFIRIHDKYIINLAGIRAYLRGAGGGQVTLETETVLPVAARRKEEFLSKFEKWTRRKS